MSGMGLAREIPSLHAVLLREDVAGLLAHYPRPLVLDSAREVMSRLRSGISSETEETLSMALADLAAEIRREIQKVSRPSLRQVINASGVILHTNLGRAPLGENAIRHISEVASGYCNLEFDLKSGLRSRRDQHAESLLLRVLRLKGAGTRGRRCVVVNNCAAATFLVLNSLAAGGEVIVSRGELVEIGGGFRIPEILSKSGAILKEVGTTNRTRVSDYSEALTPQTRLILRVHQSNFRMEGFTQRPTLDELLSLAGKHRVPLFDDQGTGCLVSLQEYGVSEESTLPGSVMSRADVIAASGDKLLGGPQCGLIIGTTEMVEQVRRNPLLRALRVDKLTYAALEATLIDYLTGNLDDIPVARMLRVSASAIRERCEAVIEAIRPGNCKARVRPTRSVVGGGTTPGAHLPSFAVALRHSEYPAQTLAECLRQKDPALVTRIKEDEVLIDLRTVSPEEDCLVISHLNSEI